jgi:hypothetical protein
MKTRRRLVSYILLNIFISAAVTGSLLFFYDRTYSRQDCCPTLPVATPFPGEIKAEIVSIVGTGIAASEIVTVKNNGADPLVLTGWYLKDSQGSTYTFPQLTLFPGASLKIHTLSGEDTASDLYWGRSSPAWESGELAGLYDPQNIARAFCRIP